MTYDIVQLTADKASKLVAKIIDFDLFYSPTKEESDYAVNLNNGKSLSDKRTRGYKYLQRLKQEAWNEYK